MWDYLDEINLNLLYRYAYLITGKYRQMFSAVSGETIERLKEKKCRDSFYLIWFVYKYVLECDTLEEALKHTDIDTLKRYKLNSLLEQHYMYIGFEKEIVFRRCEDIFPILEILYNRYPLWKQIVCTEKYGSAKRKGQCKRIRQKYIKMIKIYKEKNENEEDT